MLRFNAYGTAMLHVCLQVAKSLHADDKVNIEVAVLREAFARLQNTKKVCAWLGWLGWMGGLLRRTR
jgi:hypothetical protein